jgi:heme iron utilization protein
MTTESDWQKEIRALLGSCRIGFLATQGKVGPESSMAPYALYGENVLLHLSRLARHTANVEVHSTAGFMICTPETVADSPLALPRLSLQGSVVPVTADERVSAKQFYLHQIPDAEALFSFADFCLYRLAPEHIHWVGGFGSARNISLAAWKKITASDGFD